MDFIKGILSPEPHLDDNANRQFIERFNLASIPAFRVSLIFGLVLYDIYLMMDWFVIPDIIEVAVLARIGIMTPLLLATIFATRRKNYIRYHQIVMGTIFIIAVLENLAFVHLSQEPYAFIYMYGVMMVAVFFIAVLRVLFYWAATFTAIAVGLCFVSILFVDLPLAVKICTVSMIAGTALLCLVGTFLSESSARTEFVLTGEVTSARDRAIEATKLKDKFVSLVSHDLKGPLGAIKGLMSLSTEDDATHEEMKEYAKRSHSTASGLLDMLDKLLDISRLQTGSIQPQKLSFDLHQLSQEKLNKLRQLAKNKKLTLTNNIPPDTHLFADRELIGEVMINLLSNAVKFTPEGGTITLAMQDDRTITVSDTGAGIKETFLPNLFKHEVKTTSYGTAGETGTGLGLPFCNDIMTAHGGTLRVETGEYGTTFYASFPEARPIVMLVDDQEVHRLSMKEQISKISNVDYIEAEDGQEALEKLKNVTPILIVSDINMDGMDGLTFLKKVREIHTQHSLPVIISTALSGSSSTGIGKNIDTKTMSFDLGANDFITKPIIPIDFIPRVKRFLP